MNTEVDFPDEQSEGEGEAAQRPIDPLLKHVSSTSRMSIKKFTYKGILSIFKAGIGKNCNDR